MTTPSSAETGTTLEKSIGGPYIIPNYRCSEPKNLNLKPYFWVITAVLQGRGGFRNYGDFRHYDAPTLTKYVESLYEPLLER